VIKNKPFAPRYYGAQIAGPVFSEIANKLFTVDADLYASYQHPKYADSSKSEWNGSANDFKAIAKVIGKPIVDGGKKGEWSKVMTNEKSLAASSWSTQHGSMPDLKGFGLKDALELLERQQLQVIATGKGKVISQSIPAGTAVQKGQTIYLNLGSTID
jgi:cell division protein FtsI (penicillin-binding protein 3)